MFSLVSSSARFRKYNDCEEIAVSELAAGINVSDTEIVRHLFPLVKGLLGTERCSISRRSPYSVFTDTVATTAHDPTSEAVP